MPKNQEFKTPKNPSGEENSSVTATSNLPPVSIFPNQIYPYPPMMYPSPMIGPVLMHSNNFSSVQTSISLLDGINTVNYSQCPMPPQSQPTEHLRNSILATESPKTEISP